MTISSFIPAAAVVASLTTSLLSPKTATAGAIEPKGITEPQFNQVIDAIEARYQELGVFKNLGVSLTIERRWDDDTVNANMSKRGKRWFVSSYGGMARLEVMTPDAFTLMVCGQLGTLLGGFPRWLPEQKATRINAMSLSANASYYATYVCANLLWEHQHEDNAKSRDVVDHESRQFCDSLFEKTAEQNLCYRKAIAARVAATFLNRDKPVSIETPDEQIVMESQNTGGGQCSFDTYLAGAACKKSGAWQHDTYPLDEWQMAAQSCAAKEADYPYDSADVIKAGLRPFCWFKPGLE